MIDYDGPKATLTRDTTWRMSLQLVINGTQESVVLKVRFVREEGYEPPQGVIEIVEDESGMVDPEAVNRWELGEDPDEKSGNPLDNGGLFIWGLFTETPFSTMLFSINLKQYGRVYAKVP